jgi:TRAP-type C4-dicarboxylate transport system substrate-binding protein
MGPPAAALAFQWSTQAHYFSGLRLGVLAGCLLIANRAFDALPVESQQAIRTAAAKLRNRLEEVAGEQDSELLGTLFARQGLQLVPASSSFRSDYVQASAAARDRLELVPRALVERVVHLLGEYRAQHPVTEKR